MKLTGVQIESFSKALMSAFPNRGELERMVLYHFGENLNTIVEASPLTYTVHKLIEWAMARGSVAQLLKAARTANPGNEQLARLNFDGPATASVPATHPFPPSRDARRSGARLLPALPAGTPHLSTPYARGLDSQASPRRIRLRSPPPRGTPRRRRTQDPAAAGRSTLGGARRSRLTPTERKTHAESLQVHRRVLLWCGA